MNLDSLIDWSRAQFALTAMYHWLFVPLTLGLGVIMSIAETKYYKTNDPFWKSSAKFWQKIFGINFAIGVATGIILEFEFGLNWSNYSWFVGDIFGAPLAIEGILAFFMESTFIAVMFFGWGKVSKRFHLASTWLTIIGATLSAAWILIANAWMQHPVGMYFNPITMRNEMDDFWSVALSSTAVIKFLHTVISSWLVGSVFALGICSFYMIKKRNVAFAKKNIRMIAPFGLIAAVLAAMTGDQAAFDVAHQQPMKLAAMESLYDTGSSDAQGNCANGKGIPISIFGILNPNKTAQNNEDAYLFNIEVPRMLSFLGTRTYNGYLPGIKNILEGGYIKKNGEVALSVEEKMKRGREAIMSLKHFREAIKNGNSQDSLLYKNQLDKNIKYLGYGYFNSKYDVVPNVDIIYYSFRSMVGIGLFFIILFIIVIFSSYSKKENNRRWVYMLALFTTPLVWIATEAGWVVTEVGRQPWAIQGLLPLKAAVSNLTASTVIVTFALFFILFTTLLIAELSIMKKAIKEGPEVQEGDTE